MTVSQGVEQVEVPDLTDMTANEARAAGYVLGEAQGCVAVYAGGDLKTPLQVTEIELASLRGADRALIERGLHAASREEVLQILEDLGT